MPDCIVIFMQKALSVIFETPLFTKKELDLPLPERFVYQFKGMAQLLKRVGIEVS